MKYCPYCGSMISEDANFCMNCGRALSPQNGNRKDHAGGRSTDRVLIIALGAVIGLLVIVCVVIGTMLLSSRTTSVPEPGAQQQAQSAEDDLPQDPAPDLRQLYAECFRDLIIPQSGTANTGRLEGTLSWTEDYRETWYAREGVIGADFADPDADGQEEMIVYRFERAWSEEFGSEAFVIFADVYDVSDSYDVAKTGTVRMADTNGASGALEHVGIMRLGGRDYLYHHEYNFGILANGWRGYYTLYTLDGYGLRKAYLLGNPWIGSSDEHFLVETYYDTEDCETVCYAYTKYSDPDDYLRSQGVRFADHCIDFTYENLYECIQYCWEQIGVDQAVTADTFSGEPDYWNSSLVEKGFSLVIRPYDLYSTDNEVDVYSEMEVRTELIP